MSNENPGCLGQIMQLFGIKFSASDTEKELPYGVRSNFLTKAELSFYKVLTQAIDGRAIICPKVSLSDIFYVDSQDNSTRTKYLNKINRKHIDFLICDKNTVKPVCGIELDDASHQRSDRKQRDEFVDNLFEAGGLKLVRFENKKSYSLTDIKAYLDPVLEERL